MAKKFQSMDGNQAAAWCAYAFTDVACIYPITPSSPMAEHIDEWASKGELKNLFNAPVKVVELESEAGAAGSVHGSLQAGALTTTFTASQGLLLKIPNMYKMSGELLPAVIHVAARSLSAQALSIFGDHSDVMACRQTGFAMFATSSVQEIMDLAGVAHLAAIESSVPFMHFFDGFRTSHEIQKVEIMDYSVFDKLLDRKAVTAFRKRALNPNKPVERGSAQNDDVYFQAREVQNPYYDAIPDIVNKYMDAISEATGREYHPFNYYGAEDATDIIISMGSVNQCIEEVVDYEMAKGEKIGAINVHLYRPFSVKYLLKVLPKTVKRIAVLDRTKEPGSIGEPLFLDIKAAFYNEENAPVIVGGRYGLSSKNTTPSDILAVYKNLRAGKDMKDHFTIGIDDDVTFLSLPVTEFIEAGSPRATQLVFWGLGSDGTVGANKSTIKLIGDNTDYYAQAYFAYDSKKSGGVTRSNLRFSPDPIRSTYLVGNADFVSCSLDTYVKKYDMLRQLKQNGTFLLNTTKSMEELLEFLPNSFKAQLAKKNAKFYMIDAVDLAIKIGLGNRTNTIMQSAFFKLNEQIMPFDEAVALMKKYAKKAYFKKGQAIVDLNYKAIDIGGGELQEVKVEKEWAKLTGGEMLQQKAPTEFTEKIARPINELKGYDLPVSAFKDFADGTMESGTTQYEKREVSTFVSVWDSSLCIQCNKCSFACPHAVIRPFLVDEKEQAKAPASAQYLAPHAKDLKDLKFTIQISAADCTGCGVCVERCPKDALSLVNADNLREAGTYYDSAYFFNNVTYKTDRVDKTKNVVNSQFAQPLFEFSGACAGCGETPYIKLATQLFGDRMVIANATGCTSIYGGSYPSSPYTTNKEGKGPAWASSLFEDNAEYGYGMNIASETLRNKIGMGMEGIIKDNKNAKEVELSQKWLDNRDDGAITSEVAKEIVPLLEKEDTEYAKNILEFKDYITKRSQWIIGGDGWAYDIGFGGLDHIIANQEDVNILVVDTEVYSNTGGQSSKSSPTASIAKFTAGGKKGKKKDLAAIAMSYGHVYVATIAHGSSPAQMFKAMKEAESYKGPSLIMGYAPCINHGLSKRMNNSQKQTELAVECGYWTLLRYDPRRTAEGLNPFQLDSKPPKWDLYRDHLMTERRYSQLSKVNPEEAERLLELNKTEAQRRYKMYERYAAMDYSK